MSIEERRYLTGMLTHISYFAATGARILASTKMKGVTEALGSDMPLLYMNEFFRGIESTASASVVHMRLDGLVDFFHLSEIGVGKCGPDETLSSLSDGPCASEAADISFTTSLTTDLEHSSDICDHTLLKKGSRTTPSNASKESFDFPGMSADIEAEVSAWVQDVEEQLGGVGNEKQAEETGNYDWFKAYESYLKDAKSGDWSDYLVARRPIAGRKSGYGEDSNEGTHNTGLRRTCKRLFGLGKGKWKSLRGDYAAFGEGEKQNRKGHFTLKTTLAFLLKGRRL